MEENNYCFIKEGLQQEIDTYEKTGDLKTYLNFLNYLNLSDSKDQKLCSDMINSSLTIEQNLELVSLEKDFDLLMKTAYERRKEFYSNSKEENDLQKFINFFSAINIEEMSFDEMNEFTNETIFKIELNEYQQIKLV